MTEKGWWARLKASLGDRRVVPPEPPGRRAHVPAVDPAEAATPGRSDESSGWSVFITYGDGKSEESSRVITLRSIAGHYGEPTTIGAHCHLRRQHRTFRVDRITGMACAATGEELDPVEHCIALHRSGALKIEDLVLTRLMRVLTFMARCDGEFHTLERSALEDVLGRYFRFFGGDDDAFECALRESPRLAPSAEDVIKALGWMKRAPRGPELSRFVLNSCGTVIDADGRHADEEVYWAVEVSSALKRIADRNVHA